MALKAMKNWRTSWLSREAIALGAFTGLTFFITLLYWMQIHGFGLLLLQALTLAIGIYGIYAQSMIYRIKARPSWDRVSTNRKFFATGYVGFLLIATALLAYNGAQGAMVLLAVSLLAGMIQTLIIFEEVMFYAHLNKNEPLYYQYNRSRILLKEHFGTIKKFRMYSLALSALVLPLLAILFTASGLVGWATMTLLVATIGAFVSELSGRYLFYTTVVPLGLAGNFFAGNQRG